MTSKTNRLAEKIADEMRERGLMLREDVVKLISSALAEREQKVSGLVEAAKDELDPWKDVYSCQKGLMPWCRCNKCREIRLRAALQEME